MNFKVITVILLCLLLWGCSTQKQNILFNEEMPDRDKLKTCSEVEYEYINGKPNPESAFTVSIKEYDTEGSLVKKTKLFRNDLMKKYEELNLYYYNESGNTDSILIYNPSDQQLKEKWVYEHKGNDFTVYEYSDTGELQSISEFISNENDDVISVKDYLPDGTLSRESYTTYDEIGEKSYTVVYDGEIWKERIRVNDDPFLLKFETMNNKGNLIERITYVYDEKGRLIEDVTINYVDEDDYYHWKFHYFENDLSKEDIKYNKQGEPIKLTIYNYEEWE